MWYNSLLESVMVTVAIVIGSAFVLGPKEVGTSKLMVNVSSPSTMLSFITVMFTVLLVSPAIIFIICVADLKSTLPPTERKLVM